MLGGGRLLTKVSFPRPCFSLGTLALIWMQLPGSQDPALAQGTLEEQWHRGLDPFLIPPSIRNGVSCAEHLQP